MAIWLVAAAYSLPTLAQDPVKAPVPAKPVDDFVFVIGDAAQQSRLVGVFGNRPTYCVAESSDESVVQAFVLGYDLTVTPVGVGEATIAITATNSAGSATISVGVSVLDRAPEAVGQLSDAEVTVGETLTIDIRDAFTGTNLEYSAASSSDEMATATTSGSRVSVAGRAAGDVTVTVTAMNTGGSATQALTVTVRDRPPVAVGALDDVTLTIGDTLAVDVSAVFGGNALVYSAASSAPDTATAAVSGSTVTVAALDQGAATVTVTAQNSSGSVTQAMAVTVRDEVPTPMGALADVTLTVGDTLAVDVSESFGGTSLVLSVASSAEQTATATLSGTTVSLDALVAGSATITLTASNSAGSATQAFVVSVDDQLPTRTGSLPRVRLTTGGDPAIVNVADSFDGTALVYSVAGSGAAVAVSISGTEVRVAPLVEGEATVTVTASNSAGNAMQSFTATVTTDAAESSAMTKGLAAIGASTLSSVTSAISARLADARGAMMSSSAAASGWQAGDRLGWGTQAANGWQAPGGMGWGTQAAFGPRDPNFGWGTANHWQPFANGFGATGFSSLNAAPGAEVKWQQPARWTVWGHADRQSFEGSGYDGGLTSVYVGADADFGERWIAGLAVSQSTGEADYAFTGSGASGTGSIEPDMLSIFPYVRWSLGDEAEVWAILGFGWGDTSHSRSATRQRGSADLSMRMASVGGRRALSSVDAWDFSLLGDASLLDLQTDGGVGIVNDLQVGISRLRGGLEAGRDMELESGASLTWFGQIAARHDGGDGDTGAGAELTGGFRYDSMARVSVEAKARVLGVHSADEYEESGFSVTALVRPGPDGEGMSFALSSHTGTGMRGGESLVGGYGQSDIDRWRDRDNWALDARLGYTVGSYRLPGSLTPFAEVDIGQRSRHTMLGVRADFSAHKRLDRLDVELAGGRGRYELRGGSGPVVKLRAALRF